MNKNSNTYIIIYSTVMVVVVAIVLAVAALSLQDRQVANELDEKKGNILNSLGMDLSTDFDAAIEAYVVDEEGTAGTVGASVAFDILKSNKSLRESRAEDRYLLFRNKEDGRVVIPIVGKGLWGDIWGYLALENDMNTVSGIVLAHQGETPGLGAEIATEKHQALYKGKKLFEEGEFVSISLRKGGAKDPEHEVDAITGGTKTSDGVTAMLKECLNSYVPYFKTAAAEAPAAEEGAGEAVEQSENN